MTNINIFNIYLTFNQINYYEKNVLLAFALLLSALTTFIACSEENAVDIKHSSTQKSLNVSQVQDSIVIIGEVDSNGDYVITADLQDIKDYFEENLSQQNIQTKLVNFEILKDTVQGTTDVEYYYLKGSNFAGDVKIVTLLEKEVKPKMLAGSMSLSGKLSNTLVRAFRGVCTCSGTCTKGCDPKRWMDKEKEINWMCSSCTQSKRTCVKSVTTDETS